MIMVVITTTSGSNYFCSSNGIKVTIIMKQWYNTNGNINSGDVSIVIIIIIIILTIILQ
jgi:hypothetical protein